MGGTRGVKGVEKSRNGENTVFMHDIFKQLKIKNNLNYTMKLA